jgi:hypothetical protein
MVIKNLLSPPGNRALQLMGDAEKATAGGFKLSRCLIEGKYIEPKPYTTKPYVRFSLTESKGKK